MSVSQETKTLFSSGPIRFSDLRTNFVRQPGAPVKASDLYRETGIGVTNPIDLSKMKCGYKYKN